MSEYVDPDRSEPGHHSWDAGGALEVVLDTSGAYPDISVCAEGEPLFTLDRFTAHAMAQALFSASALATPLRGRAS